MVSHEATEKLRQARQFFDVGHYEEALRHVHDLNNVYPHTHEILLLLAQCLEKTGRIDEALQAYEHLSIRFQDPVAVERVHCLSLVATPLETQIDKPGLHRALPRVAVWKTPLGLIFTILILVLAALLILCLICFPEIALSILVPLRMVYYRTPARALL